LLLNFYRQRPSNTFHDKSHEKTPPAGAQVHQALVQLSDREEARWGEFSQEEIRYNIDSTLDGEMPRHQLAALLMAVYFANMSAQETAILTEEMMLSGEVIDLSHIAKPKIDKYSTGGVGDKTSLVLVPLAMASGVVVPMMCGTDQEYVIKYPRPTGLHPGVQGSPVHPHFIEQLGRIGGAVVAQVPDLAPADAKFYELRRIPARFRACH